MIDEIATLVDPLRSGSHAAYLYGGQVRQPNPANDFDLLFIYKEGNKEDLVERICRIQIGSKYLLHPVFISREAFDRNPYFPVLIRAGKRLW